MKYFYSICGGLCWVFGLMFMASEVWMPWSQVIGIIIFASSLFFAWRANGH